MKASKMFDELSWYVDREKFEKPRTIINIKQLATYKTATEDEKKELLEAALNHRMSKSGIYFKGYHLFMDTKTYDVKTEDIHFVTVKVVNSRNKPKAIATFNSNISKVELNGKYFYRNGTEPLQLQMNAANLDNIFYHGSYWVDGDTASHDMLTEAIVFTPDSIEEFYGFGKVSFVKFTKSVVEKFWNSEEDLYRYNTNLTSHSNGWGLCFAIWSCKLIERGWGTAYVDEDIRLDEIDAIAEGHEDSWVVRDARRKYKTVHTTDEEEKNKVIGIVDGKINEIQELVNANEEYIVDYAIDNMGVTIPDASTDDKKKYLASKDGLYGLDCGFLYFRFSDSDTNEKVKEAADYGSSLCYSDGTFTLNIPVFCQSTNIQRMQAAAIKKLAEDKGIKISYHTVLD